MPTFTGKTFSSFYKNILGINQAGNTGADATTRVVHDGAGNSTSISLSDDVLSVQPVNDDSVGTLLCKSNGGDNILAVDTTNSKVLIGASQVAANTQYAYFGVESLEFATIAANNHVMVPFSSNSVAVGTAMYIGTGTDPDTSMSITTKADNVTQAFWYLPDNITINAVNWFHGGDNATGDVARAHLMSYAIDTANGSTSGDLSDGTVIADGADITNAGYEQVYYQAMTVQSANVAAGRVLIFTFRNDSVNGNYSINVTVKYHIR